MQMYLDQNHLLGDLHVYQNHSLGTYMQKYLDQNHLLGTYMWMYPDQNHLPGTYM